MRDAVKILVEESQRKSAMRNDANRVGTKFKLGDWVLIYKKEEHKGRSVKLQFKYNDTLEIIVSHGDGIFMQ